MFHVSGAISTPIYFQGDTPKDPHEDKADTDDDSKGDKSSVSIYSQSNYH